jgi:hypothetical protein
MELADERPKGRDDALRLAGREIPAGTFTYTGPFSRL